MDEWPDADATVDERKVVDYLLSPEHPSGRAKARFFAGFGFTRTDWRTFGDALLIHRQSGLVVETEVIDYGEKYVVEGQLQSPDGRNPRIRAVWFKPLAGPAILVTAYPMKERRTDG